MGVRQSMQRFVAEMARPVVLSDRAIASWPVSRYARSQLNRAGNQEPTTEDLMTVAGFARDQIEGPLGEVLHVSAERVRQIEAAALKKLRAALASPGASFVQP